MRRCIVILLALVVTCSAMAKGGVAGLRTEWGVVAGVHQPIARFDMGSIGNAVSHRFGGTTIPDGA